MGVTQKFTFTAHDLHRQSRDCNRVIGAFTSVKLLESVVDIFAYYFVYLALLRIYLYDLMINIIVLQSVTV
jgi:hypothetical protein